MASEDSASSRENSLVTMIEKCPEEKQTAFMNAVIDQSLGNPAPRYQDYAKIWSLEEWWEITDKIKDVAKIIVKSGYTTAEQARESIAAELRNNALIDAVLIRGDEIKKRLNENTVAISHRSLKDFDWKVKLVMSSSKLVNVNEPLCNLDSYTLDTDGCKDVTSVELDANELRGLIAKLENAHKVVQNLSA
ncbi:COMM domain-containing protein 8-like [Tubulanus polymorphus]|uniref:COMM domain-containing protein 8-like n=1 Tax=Tubulanus polymorphus TaxID=672921 RepID=UPI003DA483E8